MFCFPSHLSLVVMFYSLFQLGNVKGSMVQYTNWPEGLEMTLRLTMKPFLIHFPYEYSQSQSCYWIKSISLNGSLKLTSQLLQSHPHIHTTGTKVLYQRVDICVLLRFLDIATNLTIEQVKVHLLSRKAPTELQM